MATIQIPVEIESQIEEVANRMGESKEDLVRDALLSFLEDMHDVSVAREYLANPQDLLSLDDLKKNLGLDD
jgi:predicted DNA-binding protein